MDKTMGAISVDDFNEYNSLKASKEKFNIEFQRYKQDCRKRALEMAHAEINYQKTSNQLGMQIPSIINHDTILKNADNYYNWLISIPETK